MEKKKTSEQIRATIEVNEETRKQAFSTLREILDEKEPHRPYYLERLITSLNVCSDICKSRARLEYDLQKAIQAGDQFFQKKVKKFCYLNFLLYLCNQKG